MLYYVPLDTISHDRSPTQGYGNCLHSEGCQSDFVWFAVGNPFLFTASESFDSSLAESRIPASIDRGVCIGSLQRVYLLVHCSRDFADVWQSST